MVFTLLVPAYPGCPEKRPLNGCLFVFNKVMEYRTVSKLMMLVRGLHVEDGHCDCHSIGTGVIGETMLGKNVVIILYHVKFHRAQSLLLFFWHAPLGSM